MEFTKRYAAEILKRCDWYLVFVIGLPFLVLSFYRGWILTFPSHLDPWYSLGYFLHLREYLKFSADYYVSGRLAFFLPGSLLFTILPPVAANYTLHVLLYWAATIATYLIVKKTLGRRTALIGTTLLGTYWHFLSQIGWNYVDGGGIAYYLLSLLMITLAVDSRYRFLWMMLAGVCTAATLNTNLFLVTVMPLLIIYSIGLSWRHAERRFVWDLTLLTLGFGAGTLALSLAYYGVTGKFLIMGPQIAKGIELLTHKGSTVRYLGYDVPPLREWLSDSRWLRLPFAICLTSIIHLCLALKWKQCRSRNALLFQLLYVIQCLIMVVLQKHGRVLILSWYASYLIPTMFLALAGQLAVAVEALRDYQARELVVLLVGGLALLLQLPQSSPIIGLCNTVFERYAYALAILGAISAALTLVTISLGRWRALQLVLVGVVCCAVTVMNYGATYQDETHLKFKKDAFVAICRGIETIDGVRGPMRSVRFWYKPDFPEAPWIYTSLNSVYLWSYTLHNMQFPELTTEVAPGKAGIRSGQTLVILSKSGGVFEEARQALDRIGSDAILLKEETVQHRNVSYTITLVKTLGRKEATAEVAHRL